MKPRFYGDFPVYDLVVGIFVICVVLVVIWFATRKKQ
jgi:hypothetical protein